MHFIFYQNILSMHQSAFLRSLAAMPEVGVTLVVEAKEEVGRSKQGWLQPDFGKCRIAMAPLDEELTGLVSEREAIHVFGGMFAFPMVARAFTRSCAIADMRRMVFSEPWRGDGWKGKVRYLRYRWLAWKYGKKVEAFLLTGHLGVESYLKAGFPKERCHEWGYYTETPNTDVAIPLEREHTVPRLIFIGTWDVRKNILTLVWTLKEVSLPFECLLLGDGYFRPQVEELIAHDSRFRLVGNVPNRSIGGWLSACDVLVLPSLFDGWGAVVNEALQCGTRALVSECCGAASLVVSSEHGGVFALSHMKEALETQLKRGLQSPEARTRVKEWSEKAISGDAVARRFLDIVAGNKA